MRSGSRILIKLKAYSIDKEPVLRDGIGVEEEFRTSQSFVKEVAGEGGNPLED